MLVCCAPCSCRLVGLQPPEPKQDDDDDSKDSKKPAAPVNPNNPNGVTADPIKDLMADAELLEWAGVNLGKEEMFQLQLSIQELCDEKVHTPPLPSPLFAQHTNKWADQTAESGVHSIDRSIDRLRAVFAPPPCAPHSALALAFGRWRPSSRWTAFGFGAK